MTDPFVGEIMWTPYNFPPQGWAMCNGQLLPISQNTALFALLGTTYGGNGTSNFALPDLRGRSAMHFGQGPGLSQYVLGEVIGQEGVTLNVNQLPAHRHQAVGSAATGTSPSLVGNVWAASSMGDGIYSSAAPDTSMNPLALAPSGSFTPAAHENRQPFLAINFCIALRGIFPAQN
jgi:microcystin-dependent protein